MLNQRDIEQVLDEVGRGNTDAFRHIIREYGLSIRSYLCSQIYHLDEADDLAQEVFIAAYRSLASFRRGEDFSAWLRGIARNKLRTYFRSSIRRNSVLDRFREEVLSLVADDHDNAVKVDRSEDIEMLLRCVAKLPEKLRRVVHAGLEGAKPLALAEELSTTVGAVYNLHYRANQLLRECVQKELTGGC
jgi:RNA polymerase sigma-70 factor (ECF subfamily)